MLDRSKGKTLTEQLLNNESFDVKYHVDRLNAALMTEGYKLRKIIVSKTDKGIIFEEEKDV